MMMMMMHDDDKNYPEVAAHLAMVWIKRLLNQRKHVTSKSALNLNEMRKLQSTKEQLSRLRNYVNYVTFIFRTVSCLYMCYKYLRWLYFRDTFYDSVSRKRKVWSHIVIAKWMVPAPHSGGPPFWTVRRKNYYKGSVTVRAPSPGKKIFSYTG